MKARSVLLAMAVGAAIPTAIAVAWASPPATPHATEPEGRHAVTVETARRGPVEHQHILRGVTRAQDQALIAFTAGGRLEQRPVEQGQHVEAGDLLAALDAAPLRNQASAARAQVRELRARDSQARRDQARTADLVRAGAVSARQLEQANAGAEAIDASTARAKVAAREASRQLRESRIVAPFSGTVTELSVEEGEVVGAGTPVMALVGDGGVEVEVEAPERFASLLRVGDVVEVELTACERTVGGTIQHVADGAAYPGRLFAIVVALDGDDDVRPGMAAAVRFTTTGPDRVSVPLASIFDPSGSAPRVFVVVDGRVQQRALRLGETIGDRVVVLDGLAQDEVVVTAGQARLLDGDEVEVAP